MKRISATLALAALAPFLIAETRAQSAAPGIPADAVLMKDWSHENGRWFSYFMPTADWRAVETANGIDITSPTGDEVVSFAYASGRGIPLNQLEAAVFQGGNAVDVAIVARTPGPNGTETVEFTATRNGVPVHGKLMAQTGPDGFSSYALVAPATAWQRDERGLMAIKKHITFLGRGN